MADIKKENSIQREAFDFYYDLGEKRSLKAVAIHFKRSERTVANWSRDYNWVDRCTQKALDEAEGREKDIAILDVKTGYRQLFNGLLAVAKKDFKDGKLKIRNISDLERIVKLELALMDSPVDNLNVSGEITLNAEQEELVSNLIKEMKSGLNNLRA